MKFLKLILSKRWIQHLAFWVLSFYTIGAYFSISNFLKIIDFVYSLIFHIPLMLLVYVNLRFLVPRFFLRESYFLFVLGSALNIGIAYLIHELAFDHLIPILTTDFYLVSFTEMWVLLTIFAIYSLLSTLLKLSKSWYNLQAVERERLSLELNSLKMQINPHFLFNSLNSIYALSLKKSDRTPKSILELSNLMRYMIYEVSEEKVALSQEIDALQHYLRLQELRLDDGVNLNLKIEVDDPQKGIAPLLFFPLIENSFKHGLKDSDNNYVDGYLKSNSEKLEFYLANNKGGSQDLEKGRYGGLGLQNVHRRLKLIYGDRARLEIKEEEKSFRIKLEIDWDD